MFRDALCAVAVLAPALTCALILPPGISSTSATAATSFPGRLNLDPLSRSITLPCPACAFSLDQVDVEDDANHDAADHDPWLWVPDGSRIALDFRVSSDGERLELNGATIYPSKFPRTSHFSHADPVYVDPVSTHSDLIEPLEVTSSIWRVEEEHPASDHGDVIVPITYQILALDMQQMSDLPVVAIDLLKTGDGKLFILKVDTRNSPEVDLAPLSDVEEPAQSSTPGDCKPWLSFLCKLKSVLAQKWSAFRHAHDESRPPCPDTSRPIHLSSHIRPHFDAEGELHHHHFHDHHSHDGHESSRHFGTFSDHHTHGHHVLHAVARGLIGALIPILAGITVGLSVSFLGLAAGRLIGWIFTKLSGRGRSQGHNDQYTSLAQHEADHEAAYYEGKMLSEEDEIDIPPAYEQAPAYDELE